MRKIFYALCFLMLSFNSFSQDDGSRCSTDLECDSLCCNNSTATCSAHNPAGNLFCAKESGETCITNEFCRSYAVTECKLVKSGYNSDGSPACTLRCPSVMKQGSCIENICQAPMNPPVPNYDPKDCSKAVDP